MSTYLFGAVIQLRALIDLKRLDLLKRAIYARHIMSFALVTTAKHA